MTFCRSVLLDWFIRIRAAQAVDLTNIFIDKNISLACSRKAKAPLLEFVVTAQMMLN